MRFATTHTEASAGSLVHHSLTIGQRALLKRVSAAHDSAGGVLARDRRRIETVLDRIRPMLRADGLDVELVEVRERGASVHLAGVSSTRWCRSASLNFHTDLERVLRQKIARFGELLLV